MLIVYFHVLRCCLIQCLLKQKWNQLKICALLDFLKYGDYIGGGKAPEEKISAGDGIANANHSFWCQVMHPCMFCQFTTPSRWKGAVDIYHLHEMGSNSSTTQGGHMIHELLRAVSFVAECEEFGQGGVHTPVIQCNYYFGKCVISERKT
jgi:hypothetical protein